MVTRRAVLSGLAVAALAACQKRITSAPLEPSPGQGPDNDGMGQSGDVAQPAPILDQQGTLNQGGHASSFGVLSGLKVAIDVGHSASGSDRGAFGKGISEYELNVAQANTIARQLRAKGASVSLFHYPQTTELDERGRNAAGHHLFISVHHNAFMSGTAQGTEVLVDTSSQNAADQALAQRMNSAIVRALWGNAPGGLDRGAKAQPLGVLRNAPRSVHAKCLSEAFFITASGLTLTQARTMSEKAGMATAASVESYWIDQRSRASVAALAQSSWTDESHDFVPWPQADDDLGLYADH